MAFKKYVIVSIAHLLLLGSLVGCSLDRWEGVEAGAYFVASGEGVANLIGSEDVQLMEVDRQHGTLEFFLVDGSEIEITFKSRDKVDWPAGCPTNLHMTHMEVLDLDVETLTIGSTTIRDPILVRDCPRNPERVVLRSDGEMGGNGTACTHSQECTYFKRQ